jgi:hypothetical protein
MRILQHFLFGGIYTAFLAILVEKYRQNAIVAIIYMAVPFGVYYLTYVSYYTNGGKSARNLLMHFFLAAIICLIALTLTYFLSLYINLAKAFFYGILFLGIMCYTYLKYQ